jgi:hypothetical protein
MAVVSKSRDPGDSGLDTFNIRRHCLNVSGFRNVTYLKSTTTVTWGTTLHTPRAREHLIVRDGRKLIV